MSNTRPGLFAVLLAVTAVVLGTWLAAPTGGCREDPEPEALAGRVMALYEQGMFAEVLPLAEKLHDRRVARHGGGSPQAAEALFILGNIHYNLSNYEQARALHETALARREEAFGPRHPDVAASLDRLAMANYRLGNPGRAVDLLERAVRIRERALGPDHPDLASSLSNLALVLGARGEYARAEPLHRRAIEINKKVLGPGHPNLAASLSNLADLHAGAGRREKATELHKKALAIREKALGPEHPDVATNLNNLAALYHRAGNYDEAERLYERAVRITEKHLGPDHPALASALSNLALLYGRLGRYGKAEQLHERALAIRMASLGPEHPRTAGSLNNLATLYMQLSEYERAVPLYRSALAIQERHLGPEHPELASVLTNLGTAYLSLRQPALARPLYKRALAIREKAFDPPHPDIANSRNTLAILHMRLGEYDMAGDLFTMALEGRRQTLGAGHPDVAESMNNLATLYHTLGEFDKARSLYEKTLDLWRDNLGARHPTVATGYTNLATLCAAIGEYDKALDYFLQARAVDDMIIDQVLGFGSEKRKTRFLSRRMDSLHSLLGLVSRHLSDDPEAVRHAYEAWVRWKGARLLAEQRYHEALLHKGDPGAMEAFQKLTGIRERLSGLVFAGPGEQGVREHRLEIAGLMAVKERLEARLSRLSRAYAVERDPATATLENIAAHLPEGSALVEFATVFMPDFSAFRDTRSWKDAHHLAFVVTGPDPARVRLVDLGETEAVDAAVYRLKKACTRTGTRDSAEVRRLAQTAWDLVVAPLGLKPSALKRLYVAPDGRLFLIPFEVFMDPEGRYLVERTTVNYVTSGRELSVFGTRPDATGRAVLMGDPDFNLGERGRTLALEELGLPSPAREAMRGVTGVRHFRRLPETAREVAAIRDILGPENSVTYTGPHALEEVLHDMERAPRILHLATHGFFLRDVPAESGDQPGFRGIVQPLARPRRLPDVENPLLRSGFALAGANNAVDSGDSGGGSGLVTSEEILGLSLYGTNMVVLSACETGLGAILNGQGVFGLQSAFRQAGAKSLVMSMWEVPDLETRELMVDFHKNAASGNMDRCEALRRAALEAMETARNRYGFAHPLYWGAFVFMGEP
ncbi:MAG: tetratricopeptide repeat protein [Desulfatibacillaceae bacterium]